MSQLSEFIGNNLFLASAFFAVLAAYIYALVSDRNTAFTKISTDQLTRLVNQENAKVIDVRSSDSYANGHIVNAINIPLEDIESGKAKMSGLKKKPIIAYCDRGVSSQRACKTLVDQGFSPVFNLTGGINTWMSDKLPLSKP